VKGCLGRPARIDAQTSMIGGLVRRRPGWSMSEHSLARISHRGSSRGSGERPECEAHGFFATRHS